MRITSCGITDVGLKRGHNEDNYLIQKFTRAVMETNTVDHCARL